MIVDALQGQSNRRAAWLFLRWMDQTYRRQLIRRALQGKPFKVPGSHGPHGVA
jgi:hypothetical protein